MKKRTECGDSESESEIDKQGFFEDEAELSGSEAEQDEDDEGESGDDDSIVYSGDESELPGASELQDQLGKIYLKDQMDEDKRQLRLFKEMYLADGETNKKDLRKKQFRWKHLDNNTDNNRFSSEDEVEDEDDEDEDANDTDSRDGSKKNEKYMKLMENRNWRMVRHEREQFVKLKANAETLLSDDELEELEEKKRKKKKQAYDDDSETEYIDENSDDETSRKKSELSNSNSIFKMGQNLLKKKKAPLNKSDQNKRALNGEINAISRLVPKTSNESKSDDPNGDTKHITPGNTENLLKKFSFLNRDKGYLSKLSSYVNKNFTNIDNANAAKTKSRNNTGMVFTKIDLAADDDEETKYSKPAYMNSAAVNSSSVAIYEKRVKEDTCEATTSKITITPTPKRAKYDTCESIFNHIN